MIDHSLLSIPNINETIADTLTFREGAHAVLYDGASLATQDLFHMTLMGSIALDGQPVRCSGILPGVTLWAATGGLRPRDGGDAEQVVGEIWHLIHPKLRDWLTMPASPAGITMALGDHIRLEFDWDGRCDIPDAAMTLEVRRDAATAAAYLKQRKRHPLIERPPTPEEMDRLRFAAIRDRLVWALSRSSDVANPKFARLPVPVRFRVTGAIAAWQALREAMDTVMSPGLTSTLETCSLMQLVRYFDQLVHDLLPDGTDGRSADELTSLAQYGATWLAFEVRNGAFYEPTPPLHRLLDASYIAGDVPIGMLTLPVDTLCIIPEPVRWHRSDDVEAIVIFRTERALGFAIWTSSRDGRRLVSMDALNLPLGDPAKTIRELLDASFRGSHPDDAALSVWRNALDYAIKMLLYLKTRDAQIVHDRARSNAPREFRGLGKRRRAERLAEIELLYDRHIVGPAILDAEAARSVPTDGRHHEVRGHWRRPHFRMQPHGPRASLRKLVFIGPTIVRADRLGLG